MFISFQKSVLSGSVALALAASSMSPGALAQSRQLEEVLVTAQKRSESAQEVPVALTALSADMLRDGGINQTMDLVKLSPSLTISQGDNKQSGGFKLRGIGTNVFSIGVEQSVAVIIDDVSTVQSGQSIGNLVDIERIEVLRGPQSTLFGKSASAGVISIVTKAPAEEFEGSVEASFTDDDEKRVLASISGPISDGLSYRLSGNWSDRDGFVDNLTTGADSNGEESQGVRGKLRWDISDTVQADLIAYYSNVESTMGAFTWRELDPNAIVFGIVPGDLAAGIRPSDETLDARGDDGPEDEVKNRGASLRFNVELGEFTLTSITATDTWEYSNLGDVDFSDIDVFGFFTGGAINGGFYSESTVETDFFSQEFRLASPRYEHFEYLLGLYYADADTDRGFIRNLGLPIIPAAWDATTGTESIAAFGSGTWRFDDATSVTVGLRWNREEISVDFEDKLLDPAMLISEDDTDTEVLANISLQHFFAEETMVYARYAQGYKGQAYDIATGFGQVKADNPAAPETSDAYEIGIKSTMFDNRVQLNAAAFYTEYEDFQAQSTSILPDGSFLATLNNVGILETQGIELEGVALLGESLTVTFGGSYIDAVIKEFDGADCYGGQTEAQGCVGGTQDISDGDLPAAPKWKCS